MPKSIRQKLTLKQTQTLTPQLVHSLKILQFNQQELEVEISRMLAENVMLERHNEGFDFIAENQEHHLEHDDFGNGLLDDRLPSELDIDTSWDSIYEHESSAIQPSQSHQMNHFEVGWIAEEISFDTQIENAIDFSRRLYDDERPIAKKILEYLDENYFLPITAGTLAQKLNFPEKRLQHIIDVIRHLDPAGVASRNVQECLLAQLETLSNQSPAVTIAKAIVSEYFIYIDKKPSLIQQRLGISAQEFAASLSIIRSLPAYPRGEEQSHIRYIRPDVYIHQRLGMFYASLNEDKRFDIGINEDYLAATKGCTGDEQTFVKAQLRVAKFFLQALDYRNETILRVANAIIIHQQDYFHHGEKTIKPLKMKDLADLLLLNESTISRTVNDKYLSFNGNLIELRRFFATDLSATISTQSKDQNTHSSHIAASSTAAKAWIREFIKQESSESPLSDRQLEAYLGEKDIHISRRTISKYRESMGIAKSRERKNRN